MEVWVWKTTTGLGVWNVAWAFLMCSVDGFNFFIEFKRFVTFNSLVGQMQIVASVEFVAEDS